MHRLGLVTYLTDDYDRAIAWFRDGLDFDVLEDSDLGAGKRWIRVAPDPEADTGFLIARAVGQQRAAVGNAAGGRVAFILYSNDFAASSERIISAGGAFEEAPRSEPYGQVAVFRDPLGNRWDLIEPA